MDLILLQFGYDYEFGPGMFAAVIALAVSAVVVIFVLPILATALIVAHIKGLVLGRAFRLGLLASFYNFAVVLLFAVFWLFLRVPSLVPTFVLLLISTAIFAALAGRIVIDSSKDTRGPGSPETGP